MATTLTAVSTTTPCSTASSGGSSLERTRYFPRQLVTPDDLTQDQRYVREKHKRHNRMLHGWGVVCGACVRRGAGECEVIIEPGYLLGPQGDEIVIERELTVDVCKLGSGEQDGCGESASDPWCSDVKSSCPQGRLYLAVRYAECLTRPVRNPGGGCSCGCDSDACEYSRTRDSFAVAVLSTLPSSYPSTMRQPTLASLSPCDTSRTRGCAPCPAEPWVILADLVMGDACTIRTIDCFAHRRQVASFADFYWVCSPRPAATVPGVGVPTHTDQLAPVRVFGGLAGASTLIDVQEAFAGAPPRATVSMKRSDGTSVMVPAHFVVTPGETLGDLINREGDREYYDPASGQSLTLRVLFEPAGVAAATPLTNTAHAIALLEGAPFLAPAPATPTATSVDAHDTARTEPLSTLLVPAGTARLRASGTGVPGALMLGADTLVSAAGAPEVAARTAGMTIADVAAHDESAFVTHVSRGLRGQRKTQAEAAAAAAWRDARRVVDLAES